MSDASVEQFTLQYQVTLGDSISRLEALQERMNKTKDSSKDVSVLNKAVGELRGGLQEVAPAANAAVSGLMRLGGGGVLAGLIAAVAVITAMVKSMQSLNAEFEKQRSTGFQVGMTASGIEQMQRQLNAGNGRIGGQQARDLMGKLSQTAMSAYVDPSQMNRSAIAMRQIGINPMGANGQVQSTQEMADQLTAKFKAVSLEQARALGVTIGLTNDEVVALRNRNQAMTESGDVADAAAARSLAATQAMERLNSATGQISETGRRLSNTLGELLMPAFTSIVEWVNEATKGIPASLNEAALDFQVAFARIGAMFKNFDKLFQKDGSEYLAALDEAEKKVKEQNKKDKQTADQNKQTADQSYKAQAMMERNINLFAASVNAFSSSISEQQAWAAWAGEFGKGEGYRGIGSGRFGEPVGSSQSGTLNNAGYGSPFAGSSESATATSAFNFGNIRKDANSFLRFENKEDGMDAMARQLLLYQQRDGLNTLGGVINKWAPQSENDTSGYLKYMSQKLGIGIDDQINFGDPAFLGRFMHAMAGMEKGWNNISFVNQGDFRASASRVLGGANRPTMRAESRATAQAEPIAAQLAGMLGMSVEQFKRGQGVTTGDYDFNLRRLNFEAQTAYTAASEKYAVAKSGGAPNEQMAAKAKQEMLQAETNINTLRQYGNFWRSKAVEGGRERTAGLPDITVNIHGMGGARDIVEAGEKAGTMIGQAVASVANQNSSAVIK